MPEKKKFKNIVEKQKYWDGLIDLYGSGVKGRQNYIDNYDQVIKGSSGVLNKYRIQDTDLSKLPHDLKTIKKRYDSYRDRYDKIESDNTLGYDEKDKLLSKYSRLIDKSASEWDSNKSNQLKYNTKDTSWRTLLNRKDIKNKALFYASLMDEGADKFMADEESQQAPYEGFGTFGLDTAASRIDEFIDKGYINKDIKDRVIHERPRTNEKNESVYPLSYTNLDDVVSMKNAYFKEGEAIINKFEKDNKIKLSPRARDYFTIVSFNRGPGGVKEVMRDYLNAGILENDRFMEDDSFPKYREAHRNAKRRLETADMLRGEGIIEYGKGGAFDPVSMGIDLGLQALTAIGGSIGANMAAERENMYNEAADNLQTVDIKSATRGSGLQSFLQNPLSFGIGGRKKARLEAEEFNKNILKQIRNKNIASRFSTMSDAPTYTPVARQGGFIAYKGQTHEGPDGGILVDKFGNPTSISEGETVASVEGGGKNKKGEVSYYDPDSGSTYIYSDSLNFAKPARDLLSKYKLDDPDSLQYKQYKNDLLTQTMIKKKFENLTKAQEFAKETESSAEDSLNIFKKGGYLTSSKAKKMLKDGTAHGKKLTAKQKRYFGWVAGGRKEEGGELLKKTTLMPKENLQYDRDLMVNQGWMNSLKSAKDLNELYNTNVGTWKGNPMTLQQFSEMPEYVTNYYNPNYAIEFNKNRLGLPNTFQDINLGKIKQDPSLPRYQPASTITPGNEVAYYRTGGILPMYKKGKDGDEEDLTNYQRRFLKNLRIVEKIFNPDRPYAKKLADPNQQLISHIGTTGFTIPQDREINYIDIPMGQVIKEPIEDINPTSKPRTGIGKPTIARKENLNSQRVDIPNFNMPTFGKNLSPSTKYGLMNRPQEQTLALGEEDYNS